MILVVRSVQRMIMRPGGRADRLGVWPELGDGAICYALVAIHPSGVSGNSLITYRG